MKPRERKTSQKLIPVASTATRTSFGSRVRGGSGLISGLSKMPLLFGASTQSELSGKGQPLGSGVGSCQTRHFSTPGTVRDVIFRVGVQQFIHEVGRLWGRAGIKINHSRLEVGRFQGHHLAHAPEDRPGKLTRALALQYLRPARDKPHALLRYHIGIGHALHQRQSACAYASYVLRNLRGGRL